MDEQLIMAHEERVKKTRNRTIAIIGIPTIVAGYSIYSIGKLPDMIPRERLYVSSALVLGLGTAYTLAMAGNKNATSVGAFSGGTIGYALARGLFKQNPKTSLIAGALFAVGSYYLLKNPNLLAPKSVLAPKPVLTESNNAANPAPIVKSI
jgi:hypothetical protein